MKNQTFENLKALGGALLLVAGAVFLVLAVLVASKENRRWRAWAAEHCKVTREIRSRTSTTTVFHPSGKTTTADHYEPGQTCWKCDDGVEYCR